MNRITTYVIALAAVLLGLWPALVLFVLTATYVHLLRRILA